MGGITIWDVTPDWRKGAEQRHSLSSHNVCSHITPDLMLFHHEMSQNEPLFLELLLSGNLIVKPGAGGGGAEIWYWQWHCCWEKPEYIFTDLCVAAFWNKNGNACSCGLKKLPSATGRAPGPLLKCQEGTQILPETGLETARFTASCSCYRAVLPWWIVSCLKHEHK